MNEELLTFILTPSLTYPHLSRKLPDRRNWFNYLDHMYVGMEGRRGMETSLQCQEIQAAGPDLQLPG